MAVDGRTERMAASALRGLLFLILTALVIIVIALQQRAVGAHASDLSAASARQLLAGLRIADYVRAGLPPWADFVRDYGSHFPAAGLDGPRSLHDLLEGAWFLAVPPATPAALLLSALLAALLVVGAGWAVAGAAGPLPGLAVSAVLLAVPMMRAAVLEVLPDLPAAVFALLAAWAFAAYLAGGGVGMAVAFAILAAAGALTDAAACGLGLLPPLAVLAGRRLELLRRPSFWAAFAGPAAAAAWMLAGARAGEAPRPSPEILWAGLHAGLGGFILILGLIGLVFAVASGWRRQEGMDLWVALAAALLGLAVGLLARPGFDPRHLLMLLGPLVMLAAFGGMSVIGLATRGWPTLAGLVVALALLLAALPHLLVNGGRRPSGMDAAAQALLARGAANPVVLVASDAEGEAGFIAAVAQRDRALRMVVVPASALPGGGNASATAPFPADAAALRLMLDGLGVGFVVVDTAPAAGVLPQGGALQAGEADPAFRATLIAAYPRAGGSGEVRLYGLDGNETRMPDVPVLRQRLQPDLRP